MVGKYLQDIFSRELFYEFTSLFVKLSTLYMKRVQKFTSKYESLSVFGNPPPSIHTAKSPAAYSWFWMVLWWILLGFLAPYDPGRRDCMGTLEFWPGAPRWIWVKNAIVYTSNLGWQLLVAEQPLQDPVANPFPLELFSQNKSCPSPLSSS